MKRFSSNAIRDGPLFEDAVTSLERFAGGADLLRLRLNRAQLQWPRLQRGAPWKGPHLVGRLSRGSVTWEVEMTLSASIRSLVFVPQSWVIRFFLDREGRMRDRALFDLAIDSKLRGCGLVKLRIGALVSDHDIRARAMVIQQKTGRPLQIKMTSDARRSHTKIENTVRYLGVDVEDALELAEHTEV